jgi:alkylhydroperoxidase family enzyme
MSRKTTLIALLLAGAGLWPAAVTGGAPRAGEPAFPIPSDEEGWKHLPPAEKGGGQPLPSWARMMSGTLPRTTAAMLKLDYAHRAQSPIDPKLRAAMRWVTAHANHCAYSEAYAAFDAERAGLDTATLDALRRGDVSRFSAPEKAALEFARKMTVASSTVTDDEFAALVKAYGEKGAAAMVLLMAYSNFQDRILLCLGAPIESGGPLPPVDAVFTGSLSGVEMIQRPATRPSPLPKPTGSDLVEDDLEWTGLTYDELQDRLERQRRKTTRVRVPTWEEVKEAAPGYFPADQKPVRVVWTLVCVGHQPVLATAWNSTTRAFGADARPKLDRLFANNLFWVTTRAINCPYCMGHCEMTWELGGLTKDDIAERSRLLAGDDWSSFPAEEQRAYAFARKLTRSPWTISTAEIEGLKRDFGPDRAMAILWTTCRGHYMTRISNGFQLSLERDNVFRDRLINAPVPASPAQATPGR